VRISLNSGAFYIPEFVFFWGSKENSLQPFHSYVIYQKNLTMKHLALAFSLFLCSFFVSAQNVNIQFQHTNTLNCSSVSSFYIFGVNDSSAGIYNVFVDWNDGTDTTFQLNINHFYPTPTFWYSDSIFITHDFQFFRNLIPAYTVTDSQGNIIVNSTGINWQDIDFSQVRFEDLAVFPYSYYNYGTPLNTNIPIKLTNSNGVSIQDTIGYNFGLYEGLCPNDYPLLVEIDTNWLNQGYVWLQSPVWHTDSIDFGVYRDYFTDFEINQVSGDVPINFLVISRDLYPRTNSSIFATNTFVYGGVGNLSVSLGRDSLSAPDTSQVIRLEFPPGMLDIELSDLKNVQTGPGYVQFQPKYGDHLNSYFRLHVNAIDSSQFVFGNNLIKAYIVNSNDANLADDTSFFNLDFWEPCMGNTGTDIDLAVSCSFETWDSIVYYYAIVSKDICQPVNNVQIDIHHPANLIPDTASINYLNYTVINDSTVHIQYDMMQHEFETYIGIPFSFSTTSSFIDSLGFNAIVSCLNDTNGVESCQSFVPLNNCNQIDTAGFGIYSSVNYNNIHLSAYLEYFNCDASDTLNGHLLLPAGVTVLSNNLLNATLNGNVLSFQFTGSAYFELDLMGDSTTFDQLLSFELTYSNQNDTSLSNNVAYFQIQMGADFCSNYYGEISLQANFEFSQNQFVINHINPRASYCPNQIVEKIHFSSNLIPITQGLINPIVNGDTLIFTVPDSSAYQIRFNYLSFVSYGLEEFTIEYILNTDTNSLNNFAYSSALFPCCACDEISHDSISGFYSYAILIAPTQQGNIYIYNETIDCSHQLQLDIELPAGITPDLTQLPGATFSNQLLTIPVAMAPYLSSGNYAIPVFIPGTMPAGTTVDIPFTFSNGIDNSFSNNSDTIHATVLNSYDPNEKLVNKPELISPNEKDAFVYEIHFQNDGNFPAYNIKVRDTIDADLDLSTFKMLYSKHTCFPTIDYLTREVVFNFPNIMLEPSEVDSLGSQGVFLYSISELDNVPNGNTVENTAYIYFDFNPPIVTNTTLNHNGYLGVEEHVAHWDVQLYPNPVADKLYIESDSPISSVRMLTLSGTVIKHYEQWDQNFIDVSSLYNGFYLLEFVTASGVKTKRVLIQHD
jgi:uncharacterized repeat protein (TIGR01451 family)